MQNPQRSFSGRRTTGTKTDTLPRTARSWIFLIIIRAHPAGKLGEGATAVTGAELCERLFQSTPPARGGRQHGWPKSRRQANFNPRPPRGGRRYCILSCGRFMLPFQSTPPARGATPAFRPKGQTGGISIHAPREGGDNNHGTIFTGALQNFNPRPPRGGRLRRSL